MKIIGQPLKDVLSSYFEVVDSRSTKDEVTIVCPEQGCGDSSGNRSFNLKTGQTSCWRCGNPTSGHGYTWLKAHGVDVSDLKTIQQGPLKSVSEIESELGNLRIESGIVNGEIRLPRGSKRLWNSANSRVVSEIAAMALRKNLTLEDFIAGGCAYTEDIFEPPAQDWSRCCIFPTYEFGRLVYFQGRTYRVQDENGPTKLFPSRYSVPAGSKYWVYGWDEANALNVDVIIVVESILNVMSLRKALKECAADWAAPVAMFKHHISPIQVNKIMALPANEICLMFDGDAVKDMWSEARKFIATKKVSIAEMPVGIDANDNSTLALQRFEAREYWTPIKAMMAGLK